MKNISHPTRRRLELLCVIFGHDWNEYGSETEIVSGLAAFPKTFIVEEYNKCSRCLLEKHDNSGRVWLCENKLGYKLSLHDDISAAKRYADQHET